MTEDPLDQLTARLFESARSEAIPEGAAKRALEAAEREVAQKPQSAVASSWRRGWLIAAGGVSLAASAALLLRTRDTNIAISAEPSRFATVRAEPRSTPSATARVISSAISGDAPPAAPSLAPTAKSTPNLPQAPALTAPVTLSDELAALKVASGALAAGDAKTALSALDRYDRVLKGQKLRSEATLLRIEALARAGQTDASSDLAQRFVIHNPGSPLVDRARSFVVKQPVGIEQ